VFRFDEIRLGRENGERTQMFHRFLAQEAAVGRAACFDDGKCFPGTLLSLEITGLLFLEI
jgi:hypothetical protein